MVFSINLFFVQTMFEGHVQKSFIAFELGMKFVSCFIISLCLKLTQVTEMREGLDGNPFARHEQKIGGKARPAGARQIIDKQ